MSSTISFGIYFGNSSCCLAVNNDGKTYVVANAAGDRVTPNIVGFQESEVVVGPAAKQGLVKQHKSSVTGALRAIGSTKKDNLKFPLDLNCQILYDSKKPKFSVSIEGKTRIVTPDEVIKHLFVLLKAIASTHSKEDRLPVVIALPAWISDSAIAVVNQSATIAGFNIVSSIPQPAAACLAYNLLDDASENTTVLVLHCGGTSLVASVVEVYGGFLSIKATCSSYTAGDSLTSTVVNHLAKEFFQKYKGDPLENKRSHRKLYNVSENCKHVLSTIATSPVHIESLWEGVDFSSQVSRARLEGLVSSLSNDVLSLAVETLNKCNLNKTDIQKVVLTGGGFKTPKLQKVVADSFSDAQILKHIASDEALAIGAAIESNFYSKSQSKKSRSSNTNRKCLSSPIYVKMSDSSDSELVFGYRTPAPSRQSVTFDCCPSTSSLIIYEAQAPTKDPKEDQIVAEIQLNFTDEKSASLRVDFNIKNDTNLGVKVTEIASKASKFFTIGSEKSEV